MSAHKPLNLENKNILIIILNWNGWADTKECLNSVLNLKEVDFTTVVIDNGSTTDCESIEQYGLQHFKSTSVYIKEDVQQASGLSIAIPGSLVLIKNNENLGFAKANNIGIRFAELTGYEYVYLLNNDTLVESNSLQRLFKVLQTTNYVAVVPQIRYYEPADTIWCCGGEIKGFYEEYHYKNEPVNVLPDGEILDITFATGCALLFKRSYIKYLSERFFFGEEDFELSLRLKQQGLRMGCVLNSVIYHKESASIDRSAKFINKIYVHKLNRLINIKTYAPLTWPFTITYRSFKFLLLLLMVEKVGFIKSVKYASLLYYQAIKLDKVTKEMFFNILQLNIK